MIEIRNLNGVHYTNLRSVENMREAYRAVQRGVFDLDIIFRNSVGVCPVTLLKAALKEDLELNPAWYITSRMVSLSSLDSFRIC